MTVGGRAGIAAAAAASPLASRNVRRETGCDMGASARAKWADRSAGI
jgi:hypothetical protein